MQQTTIWPSIFSIIIIECIAGQTNKQKTRNNHRFIVLSCESNRLNEFKLKFGNNVIRSLWTNCCFGRSWRKYLFFTKQSINREISSYFLLNVLSAGQHK